MTFHGIVFHNANVKTIKLTDCKGTDEYLKSFVELKRRFPDVSDMKLREALHERAFVGGYRVCEVSREIRVRKVTEMSYPSYATASQKMHIDENLIRRAVETGEPVNGYTFTCVEEEIRG